MPYERKGKCVYNKETGKKKGCSSSVAKAKAYLKALYASEPEAAKEGLSQSIKDRAEGIYQAITKDPKAIKNAIKKYKKGAQDVLYGRAVNIAKNQVQTMNEERLKKAIKNVTEKLKGGQKKLDVNKNGKIDAEDFKLLKKVHEEIDFEGEMAKSELYRLVDNAKKLMSMLDDDTQLEGWVQSKITKANDYINSVTQYLEYQSVKSNSIEEKAEEYIIKK
jgi:hypothetical protein